MTTINPTPLYLSKIRLDGGTQPREKLDQNTVDEYCEAMENGATFPAVTVFYDDIDYWCVDGFHRIAAAEKKGETRINAVIRPGTLPQAQLFSFGVNKSHGLRRTNDDKQRAVKATLTHELSDDWSDGKIAEHCGVSQPMVSEIRKNLDPGHKVYEVTKRVGKDGKTYDVSKTQESNKKRATKTMTSATTTTKHVAEEDFVEEHEEPKTATGDGDAVRLNDGAGNPVPDELEPAFRLVPPAFSEMRNLLIQVRRRWSALEGALLAYPWATANHEYGVVSDRIGELRNLVHLLRVNAPYMPCVYCQATTPDLTQKCQGCRGAGWLSEGSVANAPQELRSA